MPALLFFLVLLNFLPARAQNPDFDTLLSIANNEQLTAQERMHALESAMMRLQLPIELIDSVHSRMNTDSHDSRLLYDAIAYLSRWNDYPSKGAPLELATMNRIADFLVAGGMAETAIQGIHLDLYVYQDHDMAAEYLYTLKKSIRLCLDTMQDTSLAAHFVGHYFSYHNQQLNQAEVDTLFGFLSTVMDHYHRADHVFGAGSTKEFLTSHLVCLYNDWGETDEALSLSTELIDLGVIVTDTAEFAALGSDQRPIFDGRLIRLEWLDFTGFILGSRGNWHAWDSIIHASTPEYNRLVDEEKAMVPYPRFRMMKDAWYGKTVAADSLVSFLAHQYVINNEADYRMNATFNQVIFPAVYLLRLASTVLDAMEQDPTAEQRLSPLMLPTGVNNLDALYQKALEHINRSQYHIHVLQTHILLPDWIRYHRLKGNDSRVMELQDALVSELTSEDLNFRSRLVTSIRSYYEIRNREARISLLNAKNKHARQRQLFLVLGGILALLAIFGLVNRMRFMRRTQLALDAAREKAVQSERAKQQFLANMSHEIRTPMNAIMGMTDILLRREPKKEQLTYLQAVRESSQSLLVIINDILDLARIEAGKVELENIPFSLPKILANLQTLMTLRAEEKGLGLEVVQADALPIHLMGDPNRIYQVLVNLVSNAMKFTESGWVKVLVEPTGKREGDRIRIRFTVQDTGIGMDPDEVEKVFRSFEQASSDTARKFGGTGLGLTISRQLVELQGGTITVESEKGKGSRFIFELPFTVGASAGTEHTGQDKAVAGKTKTDSLMGTRILLAEDNEFNIMVVQDELQDAIEGITLLVARNGKEAVEIVQREAVDFILMDIQMPVMDGLEATHAIRAMNGPKASTPIIAMTANVMKEEVERCREAGMDDYISKPFDTEQLLKLLVRLIGHE